jgi:hypothetical protein
MDENSRSVNPSIVSSYDPVIYCDCVNGRETVKQSGMGYEKRIESLRLRMFCYSD